MVYIILALWLACSFLKAFDAEKKINSASELLDKLWSLVEF